MTNRRQISRLSAAVLGAVAAFMTTPAIGLADSSDSDAASSSATESDASPSSSSMRQAPQHDTPGKPRLRARVVVVERPPAREARDHPDAAKSTTESRSRITLVDTPSELRRQRQIPGPPPETAAPDLPATPISATQPNTAEVIPPGPDGQVTAAGPAMKSLAGEPSPLTAPAVPATPALWTALAWVRRESQRPLADSAANAAPIVAAGVTGSKQQSPLQAVMSWFQHALNNSAPTFAAQATAVLLNHNQYSGPITLGGSDADGDVLSYTASPGSAGGALEIYGGSAVYTPPAGWNGTDSYDDTFMITASDAVSGWHIHGLVGLVNVMTFGLLGSAGHSGSGTVTFHVSPDFVPEPEPEPEPEPQPQPEPEPQPQPEPEPQPPVTPPPVTPPPPAVTSEASDRAFWTDERGVGFSVGSLGALGSQQRMEDALQKVADLGFTTIRTWGTDEYTGRILEAITRLGLPLKVQPGIWITQDAGAREQIDSALAIIAPYSDKVVGVSLGNEQVVDWNTWSSLTVPQLTSLVEYFKSQSAFPVTYNFAGETFLPDSSQWDQDLASLLQELDYVNVHSYGGFFDNRNNPAWTPALQLASVQSFESMLGDKFAALGLESKPIILGETGWQTTGYNSAVTNPANQQQYYELVSRYVYGPDARFDGMFYFNFTDESWKGGDDNWGLFREGSSTAIGTSKFSIVPVSDVLAGVSNPGPPTPTPPPPTSPPSVAGSFPVALVNNTGGNYQDDEIFVTIFGQTTPGNWAWVDASGVTHPLDHTAADAAGHLVNGGRNFANMSFTLAEAAGLQIPPRLEGARIYISLEQPLYVGISPDDSGWAGPDPMNPTDPNINTIFDWYEMTYEYGRIPFGGNTTQVDMFGLPFTFTVTQTSTSFSGTRGITLSRDEVFQRFETTMPAAFQALIQRDGDGNPLRLVAPRSQQPGVLATWFDDPINDFWTKYATQPFVYNGPGFTVTGGINAGNQLAYTVTNSGNGTSTSHVMNKPTTPDVWRADGPFLGTSLQGAFLAHLDAAFHRGVATSPQNWDNAAAYYPTGGRWNNWAQFFHVNSIGEYAYGFPYDDVNSQSPVLILTSSQPADGLTIVIGS